MADQEVLDSFLTEIKEENAENNEKTEKIAKITEKIKAKEEEDERKRLEKLEEIETNGLFPVANNRLQPSRDRCKGRLLTGLGARLGGFQPRPSDLRRAFYRLTPEQETRLANARKFAMDQNLQYVLFRQREEQSRLRKDPLANPTLKAQVIALMSRIYAGGVSVDVKEDLIRTTFGPYGVIKKVEFSWDTPNMKHKGFAFIEFETPDMAQLALMANTQHMIQGRPLKIGRPSNMPQATPFIDVMIAEANKFPRIFVSNIHKDLPQEDLRSLFETFGKISNIEMPLDATSGKHKGYAYIIYAEHRNAASAIAGLNRFDIGGQCLRVGKAITLPPDATKKRALPTATAVAAAAVAAKIKAEQGYIESLDRKRQQPTEPTIVSEPAVSESSHTGNVVEANKVEVKPEVYEGTKFSEKTEEVVVADAVSQSASIISENGSVGVATTSEPLVKETKPEESGNLPETLASEETVSIKGTDQRFIMMKKLAALRKQKNNVIIMRNMVDPEDVDETLDEDIRSECVKFGNILNVVIKEILDNELGKNVVKIFVEYENESDAGKAKAALNGRFFGGKIITVETYDTMKFKYGDYSG